MTVGVVGWDIGGVNTKVSRVALPLSDGRQPGEPLATQVRVYEIQRDPAALPAVLSSLAAAVGATSADAHAVTMTAELSQFFRTKRDGVSFVLDAVATAFPDATVRVFSVHGEFLSLAAARAAPLAVAAANWAATARVVADVAPNALLIDIGTTTTDIIPIIGGRVRPLGLTDPARLASGELLYLGAVRTPVEAITSAVPLANGSAGVSAEGFAVSGDALLWLGRLPAELYTMPTPDGRPANRSFAGERLARVVCGDRELLDDDDIDRIAAAVADAQVARTAAAVARVRARHPDVTVAVVAGIGDFVAAAAAERAGLSVVRLADALGPQAGRAAPATAVALLLARQIGPRQASQALASVDGKGDAGVAPSSHAPGPIGAVTPSGPVARPIGAVDGVLKVGGALLRDPGALRRTMAELSEALRGNRWLIVPGGGPFADAVRELDRRLTLTDEDAHWMAILAMDQYAHVLASLLPHSVMVHDEDGIAGAFVDGRLPVLAPFRWLRSADPLPHSWDVTSDSIAAWIAVTLGAPHLVLLKPAIAPLSQLVDAEFDRTRAAGTRSPTVHICTTRDVGPAVRRIRAGADFVASAPVSVA